MSLKIYSTDLPQNYDFEKTKRKDKIFALTLTAFGIASIIFAAGPIILWTATSLPKFSSNVDNYPVPTGQVLSIDNQQINVQVAQSSDGFSYFTTSYVPTGERPEKFYITIPKLEIKNALVKTDSPDFFESLAHFPGTAIPGEVGNAFITGHSLLPQFADPNDYNAIFTKLPDLEVGDIVTVELQNNVYSYIVQYKKIVDPKDLSVLKPITNGSKNLTLMTCVPPGTSLKRMVVITSLI